MFLSIEAFVTECESDSAESSLNGGIIKTLITLWILAKKV